MCEFYGQGMYKNASKKAPVARPRIRKKMNKTSTEQLFIFCAGCLVAKATRSLSVTGGAPLKMTATSRILKVHM